jgi:hypothetical protein
MTLRKAKSIARHLRLTLRQVCSGDYRVNFRDGNEMTAYYTDDLEDAVKTAVEMARTRDITQAVDETVAVERVTRAKGNAGSAPSKKPSLGAGENRRSRGACPGENQLSTFPL